jgi:ATP-dependent Clp protease ATP-binding subunit ClpA
MPKINVYLPDDLADAVREAGLPVSAICQRALQEAVTRVDGIRKVALGELDTGALAGLLPQATARMVAVLAAAIDTARTRDDARVTTGDLLNALIGEGGNLGLQVLRALDVDTTALTVPPTGEPAPEGDGTRFTIPAAAVLAAATSEATALGHNYLGCEHLLIGLAAEPGGAAGRLLRDHGADDKATRRAVTMALTGYAHLRATTGTANVATGILTAVRAELAPLVQRIEALESRLG